MNENIILRNQKLCERTAEALRARHFEVYTCNTAAEALEQALRLIPREDVVSWGGATSAVEIGLMSRLKADGYTCIDRDEATSPEERVELMRKALTCDTFLMGANAMSEDGHIVNIDGGGNRLAALMYGPKSVLMIVGANKIVKTLEDAMQRARTVAAPINAQRFDVATPCKTTGCCANCTSPDSICAQIAITRLCRPTGRIKVILVAEPLGF